MVFLVSYYLGDMYHCFSVRASCEFEALTSVLSSLPSTSQSIFHDFRVRSK